MAQRSKSCTGIQKRSLWLSKKPTE